MLICNYYSTFMHCRNSDFLIGWFVPHDTGLWQNNLLDFISRGVSSTYGTVITPWLRLTQTLTSFFFLFCSVFNLNNKNVTTLIACELSGFTSTSSLTMNSPVRLELARLVVSLLYGIRAMLVLNLPAVESQTNTQPMTVSTETVRMAISWPRKNQSECSDLPQDYFTI